MPTTEKCPCCKNQKALTTYETQFGAKTATAKACEDCAPWIPAARKNRGFSLPTTMFGVTKSWYKIIE